ncbi:hypothetical protein C2S52_006666, partial [Perilla frutescens var. hirtella]
TSVQFRPHNRDLGMVMRDVDEDLAIFLGMRNGEKERNDHVQIHNFEEFDGSTSAEPELDSLLNSESGKNDHDWLVTQQDSAADQAEVLNSEGISLNSEQGNASEESPPPADSASKLPTKRPVSSGGRKPASRAATPTGRPALPAKSKPSRASTPTSRASSRATTTATSKPMAAQVRSSTPSRAAATSSSKSVARSSTPSRATSRSSTPSSRSTIPASSKPATRSATPTRKPATPSTTPSMSASDGSSSGRKTAVKNPVPTRGSSQTVLKSRPSNPTVMLSMSHDASQNLKASLPKRPASASRGRPSAPAALSSSSNGKPRQKSCSPARARAPVSTAHKIGSTTLSRSRGYSHGGGGDDVNPVLMGTKMVERVVNMRKLAPPKQDEHITHENPKKSSHESSGFGRSLSSRSLDMAIRHMDIRRSVAVNLKPVATSSSSSVLSYFSSGNQSSSSQSSSFGVSESPITSSSGSSKSSNCVNSYFLD